MTSFADSDLRLRAAAISDSELLLAWRNDTDAVRFSGTGRAVPIDDHDRWLRARFALEDTGIWIGEVAGRPVGQIRVDRRDVGFEIHIAVAPGERGHGYGKGLVRALQARAARGGLVPLLARVDPANAPSVRLFAGCGFVNHGTSGRLLVFSWWG